MPTEKRRLRYCSFCDKSEEQVICLIAAPDAAICDECVEVARDMVGHRRVEQTQGRSPDDLTGDDNGRPIYQRSSQKNSSE